MKKQKWEVALDKFLTEWKNNKEVSGIIVWGSYITGNPTKHSDIDIQIILKRGCSWRERGNKIVDGILMEYFANPPERIPKYFEEDYLDRDMVAAHMIFTGKIYLDKYGDAKKLKSLAKRYIYKKFKKDSLSKIELNKYHLWDMIDNLEEVYLRNKIDFDYVYYNMLKEVFNIYCGFLGYPSVRDNKTYRFLTDKEDRIKYNIPDFPDRAFVSKFLNALKTSHKNNMLKNFKQLVKHVQLKMGGFRVDGWKFRSSSK
jgi:predicted nucleotidyltransferase